MKRFILAASSVLAVAIPAVALAQTPTRQHALAYQRAYSAVAQKFGHRAPGRQILKWGFDATHKATDAQVVTSTGVLQRMLQPAPSFTVPQGSTVQTSSPTSGGYTIPSSIVMCESGGNYSAVNPSSGAGGAYQILPSTWQAYGGTGLPQNASPAEQGAIAAKIYAGGAGRGQWSC